MQKECQMEDDSYIFKISISYNRIPPLNLVWQNREIWSNGHNLICRNTTIEPTRIWARSGEK
jgi:hypothetical protein